MQLFFNWLHDRPNQTSLFATAATGASVGFSHNPSAFLNVAAIHVYLTPYLFAYPWALNPTPSFLYAVLFAWNLGGLGVCAWLLVRDREDAGNRIAFLLAALLASGFLNVLNQMAQLLMFAGPLFALLYVFIRKNRSLEFFTTLVAVCLVSEDAAMAAMLFGVYTAIFEKGSRRSGLAAVAAASLYILFVLLIIQPAARAQLTPTASNTTEFVLSKLRSIDASVLLRNAFSALPVLSFLPVFGAASVFFGTPSRRSLVRIAGLALIPPFAHWGESIVVGGAHHMHPPFVFLFLALAAWLEESPAAAKDATRPQLSAFAGWCALFLVGSMRANAGNLPAKLKLPLYELAGQKEKAAALERSLSGEAKSNRAVIAAGRTIPKSASLVYWTNNRVAGFLADRSAVWQFPDLFDRADFLLIQRDAIDLVYAFDASATSDLRHAIQQGSSDARNIPMRSSEREAVIGLLVKSEKLYRVAYEDEHAVLLERTAKETLAVPSETIGFGWWRYVRPSLIRSAE